MRSAGDIAASLIAWTTSVLPEIQSTHDYPHQEDPGALPDLAVDFRQIRTIPGRSAHHPSKQFSATLSILVDEYPIRDTSRLLWSMADRLLEAQAVDRTLGQQLDASPWIIDLPGLITWNGDQTTGRVLVASADIVVSHEATNFMVAA